jgi:hypothetical protein
MGNDTIFFWGYWNWTCYFLHIVMVFLYWLLLSIVIAICFVVVGVLSNLSPFVFVLFWGLLLIIVIDNEEELHQH